MNYVFSKKKSEIGDRGFIVGDKFVSIVNEHIDIPTDYVFYAPLNASSNVDEKGNALHTSGTPTYTNVDGIPCCYFNDCWIYTTDVFLQKEISSSISFWLNSNKKKNQDPGNHIGFCGLSNAQTHNTFNIITYSDNISFRASLSAVGGAKTGAAVDSELLLNTWCHVAAVHDKDAKSLSFYINGVLKGIAQYEHFVDGSGYNPRTGFVLGNDCSWNGYESWYACDAYISSARIYNRVLNKREIVALASEFTPTK